MKVVHICENYNDANAYQERLLSRTMVSLGHEVAIIAPILIRDSCYKMTAEDWSKTEPYYKDGIRIVRLPLWFKLSRTRLPVIAHLYSSIVREKPDLLICHGIQGLHVLSVCRYKRKHRECCTVADVHADYHNSARVFLSRTILHNGLWRWCAKKAAKELDRIYYVAPSCRLFTKRMYGISDEDLAPLYLGADMSLIEGLDRTRIRSDIRQALGVREDEFLIVTAGKIDRLKKTHVLLEAIQRLKLPAVHVAIVGSVHKEYEKQLLDYQKQTPNTHFVGWVSSEKVLEYFISADLGVFPRSQSVLWQQAICCGLPCIFAYYPGGEYLNPGDNAKFLYSDDPGELAQTIQMLVSHPSELWKMRQGALTDGVERFNYIGISRKLFDFAESMRRKQS